MDTFLPFECGLPEQHAPSKKKNGKPKAHPQIVIIHPAVNKFVLEWSFRIWRQWPGSDPFYLRKEVLLRILRHWLFKLVLLGFAAMWSTTAPIADGTFKGRHLDPWQVEVEHSRRARR